MPKKIRGGQRSLTILAHAASTEGKQAQALELLGLSAYELERIDRFSFRALSCNSGPSDIWRKQATLIARSSPAFRKARWRAARILQLALSLQDDHQRRAAVVEVNKAGAGALTPGRKR